jgi:outer membrane receptor protein involved in Fe transport
MKAGRAWFLAFGLLMVARPGPSQTVGSIEGRVLDGEARPLAGVQVTVRSPSLQGTRTATTDRDGRFLIQGLPPGDYIARAEFSGLPPGEQAGVPVAADSGRTLELRMLSRFREEIEVAGASPILDATSSATTTVVEHTVFRQLPTSRTFLDLAYLAPGVVNFSGTGQPSINGTSLEENRFFVDGLDVTDPGAGTLGTTLPVDFLQEVDIKTGGFGPEYGSAPGGILNVVTRSGSNELHGSAFGFYKDDGLKSEPPANVRNERLLATRDYEAGGTLGGRIFRDRLWYFLGIDLTFGHQDWTTQQAINVTNKTDVFYYMGKLTGQLLPGHQLAFSVFGDPTENVNHALNAAGIIRDTSKSKQNNVALSYNGVAGRAIWLEALAGRLWQKRTTEPAKDGPYYLDFVGGRFAKRENCGDPDLLTDGVLFAAGCVGGTTREVPFIASRDQVRGAGTAHWKTGRLDHELKLGGGWRRSKYETNFHSPGAVPGPFLDRDGKVLNPRGLSGQLWLLWPEGVFGPDKVVELSDFDLDSRSESVEGSLFLQDRIQLLGNLTLDLGVRADSFESTGDLTATDPNLQMKFGLGDMIAPRLGIAWDPVGNGRSRIFARYDRSYASVPLGLNRFAFSFDFTYHYLFEYPEDGSLPSAHNLGKSIPCSVNALGEPIFGCPIGGSVQRVDPNLKPMYSDQFALGVEYQIGSEFSLGLTAVYNTVGDVIDDMALDGARNRFIGNPGGLLRVNPVTGEVLKTPVFFPELVREYRALQLAFQKRLRDNWQLFGSYVYSRLEGNYGGTLADDTRFVFPDLPDSTANTSGSLANDRSHQAKLYGSYQWSFGLTSGLVAQYLSGTPISKRGTFSTRPFFSRGLRFITPRGSAGRTPDLFTLDLHLGYTLRIGGPLSVSVFGDLFNVADAQKAVIVDEIWTNARANTANPNECGGPGTGPGTSCPLGNPNWGGPVTFQDPRTLRLGIRLSW